MPNKIKDLLELYKEEIDKLITVLKNENLKNEII